MTDNMEYLPGIGRVDACQGCNACSIPDGQAGSTDQLIRKVVEKVVAEVTGAPAGNTIPIGVSVRHIHITREDLETLYGSGHELTKLRDLYQPGEFAAKEVVAVLGPRMRSIQNVRILGPLRNATQVELSRTDGIQLGLDLPVRHSGDLDGASPVVLVGPKGSVHLKNAAIRASRHIHASPSEAAALGLADGELVRTRVPGDMGVTFDNVLVRIKEGLKLQMHIDTDDANAANLRCDDGAVLIR